MASERGTIATEAPPVVPATLQAPPSPELVAIDTSPRANPLKRYREPSPESLTETNHASKSARFSLRSASPTLVPIVSELEAEARRREAERTQDAANFTSDGLNLSGLASLSQAAAPEVMSRVLDDANMAAVGAMDATVKAVAAVTALAAADAHRGPSPQPDASLISMPGQVTESPTPMDLDGKDMDPSEDASHAATHDERLAAGSLSYPGPLNTNIMPAPPGRGMSYPIPSSGSTSPSSTMTPNKKHKCPYCKTEFTRHHNLKSHLLTHSQEKPYVCQQCDMRFRRLHDLKRHCKLHTGEKPHICPKCDRKFARGDALARHSKGPGGCAGRRSSMGGFDHDDLANLSPVEGDESTMSDMVYGHDVDLGLDDERRRLSLPSIKAHNLQNGGNQSNLDYSGHARQYATPTGLRPNSSLHHTGGRDRISNGSNGGVPGANTSPNLLNSAARAHTPISNLALLQAAGAAGGSGYPPVGMTESPKPLSPAALASGGDAGVPRSRSPHHSQQNPQQQQFGRQNSDRRTPPLGSVAAGQQGSKLPSLGGFAATDGGRYDQTTGQAAMASRTESGSQGSGEGSNMFATDSGIWAYAQALEERLAYMESLERENQVRVASLMSELAEVKELVKALAENAAPPTQQLAAPAAPATEPAEPVPLMPEAQSEVAAEAEAQDNRTREG